MLGRRKEPRRHLIQPLSAQRTSMKFLKIITLGILLHSVPTITFANKAEVSDTGWIGLWNEEMIEWAENENQIYRLCEKDKLSPEQLEQCKEKHLSSKIWSINVHSEPSKNSPKLGEIQITVTPGSSFQASIKSKNNKLIEFTPDLYDQDWGYGPYFHQTILKQKEWFEVAIPGVNSFAWINPKADIQYIDIKTIEIGQVYTFNSNSIVIVKIDNGSIKYRIENKSDMWCDVGTPPKVPDGEVKSINISDLINNGHLLLDIKYKRGC
jgi:hypothetical protein